MKTENERTVKLTLEKAKEWYHKGGDLKDVALQAYTEEEINDYLNTQKRPTSWEEYCESKMEKNEEGYFIDTCSEIHGCNWCRDIPDTWRNVLPSKELAEAFLAYMQLMSLRQEWIHQWSVEQNLTEDWKPDWSNEHVMKYCINVASGEICTYYKLWEQAPLSFPTKEMAEEFMNCFKDLLEIAKPLI